MPTLGQVIGKMVDFGETVQKAAKRDDGLVVANDEIQAQWQEIWRMIQMLSPENQWKLGYLSTAMVSITQACDPDFTTKSMTIDMMG
jgi:hypothetical protein